MVDTNALCLLTPSQRGSDFFRKNARIPEAVLDEVKTLHDVDVLKSLAYATSVSVLQRLVQVMCSLSVGDFSLVNLYSNKGKADPLVIACALDGLENETDLFVQDWVVVTSDAAVQNVAKEFGLDVLDGHAFRSLLVTELRSELR